MTDLPQYSWLCPDCGRRVPNKTEICRCGGLRVEVLPPGSLDTVQSAEAPTPKSGALSWAILGIVTVAAAGTLVALQVIPVRSGATGAMGATGAIGAAGPPDPPGALSAPDASAFAPTSPIAMADKPNAPGAPGAPNAPNAPVAPIAPIAPIAPDAPIAPIAPGVALEDIVSRSIPAIVSIEAGQGRGSGFFAAPRTVVTNRHVVQGNVSVTIKLSDGQTLPGRVEMSSQEYDLAIVRVDNASPSQAVLPLGTVNEVRPGQEVIAIGLALGVFQNSVTRGIISAVRRADRTVMLQTDAAINPGNSGGPLLNRVGQVVGINTLKISGAAESLGFAVAVDHARVMLSGGKLAGPVASSAQPGQTLAPAFASRSSTDATREDGTKRYGQLVENAARRASQLDSYWERIKANCPVRAAVGYDREWFGLWDERTTLTGADGSCASAVTELDGLAREVRVAMTNAQEEARRASVLPGQLREIRRRHRMDWTGFD